MNVVSTREYVENGWPFQITRSASLPASIDPMRLSRRSWVAGLMVQSLSASSSDRPPYFIALAASKFSRRASSSESELTDVSTPARSESATLYGMASIASNLKPHQSMNVP